MGHSIREKKKTYGFLPKKLVAASSKGKREAGIRTGLQEDRQ